MADDKKASQQLLQQLKQQLDAIKQEKVKNTFIYQDLRQDVLKSQGSLINWWLGAIGVILVLSGVYGFFVIDSKIKVLDGILEKAESTAAEIEIHSKNAKKYEEEAKVSASTAKKLANPEEKLTKKTEQEVKKSGTKLQKLMLKIRQEDYKTAINLWKYFIGHAYYENEKKYILIGYSNLGYSYAMEGNYKKAIDAFEKAIKIKPDYHVAYYNKGKNYRKLKEYQNAIDAFEKAIKIKPDFHEAYYNKGAAYGELKKYQEAINAYKETIKIKPNFHVAYHGIGVAYNKKAIDAKAYYNMGKIYHKLKKYKNAINAFEKAIKIKPDFHEAHRNLENALNLFKAINNNH